MEVFRSSAIWVVDFRYQGRARRWFRAFGSRDDVAALMTKELHALYGSRARLIEVRPATEEEEGAYLRGEEPKNVYCPTGR